jgi:hypothetical protein
MLTLVLLALACQQSNDGTVDSDAPDCSPRDEICDEKDNDCDGVVDEEAPGIQDFYWDKDMDSFGAGELQSACFPPQDTAQSNDDCDDTNAAIYPGKRPELCNGLDDDCDGEIDPPSAQGASAYYTDKDGDGYGVGDVDIACDLPPGTAGQDGDCDDTRADVYPTNTETWYDGVDGDCLRDNDYDADADGAESMDYGGTDCMEADPTITECRPNAGCTHPTAAMLDLGHLNVSTDIAIDANCSALVSGRRGGADYAFWMDGTGTSTTVTGYGEYDMQAVALSPLNGDAVVSHNNGGSTGLGTLAAGQLSISAFVSGKLSKGNLWLDDSFNPNPSQLVWDSSGCIWAPGLQNDGNLSCVSDTTGNVTNVLVGLDHIEAVALDNSEQLYISVEEQVLLVDTTAGTTTLFHTAGDDVLSMAFDPWLGDLYLSTNAKQIEQVPADGSASSIWQSPASQARIAISPDGWLVALEPENQDFEEWQLPRY